MLIEWSKREYSHLPWRKKHSLYRTLVSEIMLQQTTVGAVVKHFDRFVRQYPDLATLAASSQAEVTKAWQGLGYYRRAKNLHRAAIFLQEKHGGRFPSELEALMGIPGIGAYTANALRAIGRDCRALAIDANVERVLSRVYGLAQEKGPRLHKEINQLFAQNKILANMEQWGPRQLHEALMDVGRHFCRAKSVNCTDCPLRKDCRARKEMANPLELPRVSAGMRAQPSAALELTLLRVVVCRGEGVLGYVKNDGQWLSGQIEVPTLILSSADASLEQYPRYRGRVPSWWQDLPQIKTGITKYRIRNLIWQTSRKRFREFWPAQREYRHFRLSDPKHHFSSASLKILRLLGKSKPFEAHRHK